MDIMTDLVGFDDKHDDSGSSDSGEHNPFQFEINDDVPFHSIDRICENYFALKDKKWILVPREKVPLIKKGLKKVKKWFAIIKKEHSIFQSLRKAFIELQIKVDNSNQILAQTELLSKVRSDEQDQAFVKLREEFFQINEQQETLISQLKEDISEKNKKILKQERSIKMLIDDEASLYERKQILTQELNDCRKELNQIKSLKNMGMLEFQPSVDNSFSTLELLFNSKVKGFVTSFLSLDDVVSVMRTSKKLYYALAPPKVLAPLVVRIQVAHLKKEMKLLTHKENEYRDMFNTCRPDNLKQIMIKIYSNKVNITEGVVQPLKEALQLISGDQFIGASSIRTESHLFQDNLDNYLNQQKQFYASALEQLKTGFPWKIFFQQMVDTTQSTDQNIKVTQKLQMQSQVLTQRLFELGTLCSNDAGVFGMYMSQLQRCLAQLYVFTQNLQIETSNLQSLSYFIMTRLLQTFKREKKLQEELEDVKERINTYSDARNYLNEKLHENEKVLAQKQNYFSEQNNQIIQQDKIIQQQVSKLDQQEKSLTKQSDQLKVLAQKAITYKTKYNELAIQHNEILNQFLYVSRNVGDVLYQKQ